MITICKELSGSTIRFTNPTFLIPFVLCSSLDPLDTWAGGQKKTIEFVVPCNGKLKVLIKFLDSHESFPTVLSINANGKYIGDFKVKKGSGKWVEESIRIPSQLEFSIPTEYANTDEIKISIQSINGSVVYNRFC